MQTAVCVTDDKAHYYPGAATFVTKLVADKATRRLLGIQVLGAGAVDKMVDIAVTGIAAGLTLDAFDTLDFAYAPPFSTAIHPFVQACYVLENKLAGEFETFTPGAVCGRAKRRVTGFWTCSPRRPFRAPHGWIWRRWQARLQASAQTKSCFWCAPRASAATFCRTG